MRRDWFSGVGKAQNETARAAAGVSRKKLQGEAENNCIPAETGGPG